MREVIAKITVVVQIVAIMLLQFYSIAPHAGSFAKPQCRGDHAECGCSAVRVAARTCCCYQQKPACCVKDCGHGEEHLATGPDDDTSTPQVSSAPCGGSPDSVAASLDKLKFLRPESLLPTRSGNFLSSYHSLSETASGRFTEPPEHPPKRFIAA